MSHPWIRDRHSVLVAALAMTASAAACTDPVEDDPSIVARYQTSTGSELTFHDYGDGVAGVWHHGRIADGVPAEFPLEMVAPASVDLLYRRVFPDEVVPALFVTAGEQARARDVVRTGPGTPTGAPRSSGDSGSDAAFPRSEFLPLCAGLDSLDQPWTLTRRTGNTTKSSSDRETAFMTAASYRGTIRILMRYRTWFDWSTQYDRNVAAGDYDGGGVFSTVFDFDAEARIEGSGDGWHGCGAFDG